MQEQGAEFRKILDAKPRRLKETVTFTISRDMKQRMTIGLRWERRWNN